MEEANNPSRADIHDYQPEKRKRLVHPRQAQGKPFRKVLFTFLGGLACDLEGVGAGARQFKENIDFPAPTARVRIYGITQKYQLLCTLISFKYAAVLAS
ncbi:hypothetical protein AM1BK_12340 [Neobacillus kokaensis]|uniref:Uncharacterized protein n=1 Tax=Neobacillus kokaensis TaxID=2759023 RepID=A0ABQ3N8Q2_9BACI|nr:hypothetical protein AM1BK_12340 [Neobacillus kokaensis]